MTARSRKKKAELLEELTSQDAELEALKEELATVKKETTERLHQAEQKLAETVNPSKVEVTIPKNTKSDLLPPLTKTQAQADPPYALWPRVATASSLAILALLMLITLLTNLSSDASSAPVKKNVVKPLRFPGALPENGSTIGPAGAHRIIRVYGNLNDPNMPTYYKKYLYPVLKKAGSVQMIFKVLPSSRPYSRHLDDAVFSARAADKLWIFIHTYLENTAAGDPYMILHKLKIKRLPNSNTADLVDAQTQAQEHGLSEGGIAVTFKGQTSFIPFDSGQARLQRSLGLSH